MPKLEILKLDVIGPDYTEYQAELALDGRVATTFTFPKQYRYEEFPREEDFEAFLLRQAATLLESYGDARHQNFA